MVMQYRSKVVPDQVKTFLQKTAAGYIGDGPTVEFRKNLEVFTGSVKFYSTGQSRREPSWRDHGGSGIETIAPVPVTNEAAMALAAVPRQG